MLLTKSIPHISFSTHFFPNKCQPFCLPKSNYCDGKYPLNSAVQIKTKLSFICVKDVSSINKNASFATALGILC